MSRPSIANARCPCDHRGMDVPQRVDWTGVALVAEPILPLAPDTFVARLNALSMEVNSLARLERAFLEQNPIYARRLPETAGEPE